MTLTREGEWDALKLLSMCRAHLIEVDLPVCRRAIDDRFSRTWLALLVERAENTPKVEHPEQLVASWLKTRRWKVHVLFIIATRIGLLEADDGVRFNEVKRLHRKGLQPWLLDAMWNALQRESIRNPIAYLATLLKREAWVPFIERVEMEESARHVTPTAITSLVRSTLRAMQKKQARSVGTQPETTTETETGAQGAPGSRKATR